MLGATLRQTKPDIFFWLHRHREYAKTKRQNTNGVATAENIQMRLCINCINDTL